MAEFEPQHEQINRGDLFFLTHPGTEDIFSGFGLAHQPGRNDLLVGVLMVDRPNPVDPLWLRQVEQTFGGYQLVPVTAAGERGILCRMHIEPDSHNHLHQYPFEKAYALQESLKPFLDKPPKPAFRMHWSHEQRTWLSQIQHPNELPEELQAILQTTGYGCLAVEADIGVVHICHASDEDIASFVNQPVMKRWQLIKMPTAPLIRLELEILDDPDYPFLFESFLNVAEEGQAKILAQLAGQERLYLAFYGDDLGYRHTKVVPHDIQSWQLLDELILEAEKYWSQLAPERRDFDLAKKLFQRHLSS